VQSTANGSLLLGCRRRGRRRVGILTAPAKEVARDTKIHFTDVEIPRYVADRPTEQATQSDVADGAVFAQD